MSQIKGSINLPVDIGLITTNFGNISDNKTLAISNNNGVDFSIARDSKVYAVANGTVSIVGDIPFYGKVVIITLEGQTMHFELWQNSTPVNPREWLRF